MAKGVRTAAAAAALGMGLLGAVGAARADDTYDFTFQSNDNILSASGSFVVQGEPGTYTTINSIDGKYTITDGFDPAQSYLLNASFLSGIGNNVVNAVFYNDLSPINQGSNNFTPFLTFNGIVSYNKNEFSGQNLTYTATINTSFAGSVTTQGLGSFVADLVSPAPAGSSPTSGGAPSPEVNTLLGFLIVGGTVAFLKRRRKGAGAAGAAAI